MGGDVIETQFFAPGIDDDELANLLDSVNSKGMKPLVECSLSFAHELIVNGRTQIEAARRGYGPCTLIWSNAAEVHNDQTRAMRTRPCRF